MVDTDPSWLSAVLEKHERDNSITKVISVTSEPAVSVGNNYSSFILRATLKVVLGSGKVTTRKVILKKILSDLPPDVAIELIGTFSRECTVYKNILAEYEILMKENHTPYNKFWPDCMHASNTLLMFEDLKMSGFMLGPRKTGLDSIHGNLVFTNLARLHFLSMMTISKGIVYPKMLQPYPLIHSDVGKAFYTTTLTSLADAIRDTWGSEWSRVEQKIREILKDVTGILKELYAQPHKLSVINHGDCWISNMMFKYDNNGTPIDLKFLDFQMSYFNSYAWDLVYFLYTSIHPKYISTNFDSFIETYCEEFTNNLKRFGDDTSKAPTTAEVKEEIKRLQVFGIVTACAALPIVANPSDIEIDVMDMLQDTSKLRLLCEDTSFKEMMEHMFKHFINIGAI